MGEPSERQQPGKSAAPEPKPRSGPKRIRRRLQLKIAPEDQKLEVRPLEERLKEDARRGLPGLLASLVLHVLLLALLALFVRSVGGTGDDQMILLSWLTEAASTAEQPRQELNLDSFAVQETRPEPTPEPTEDPVDPTTAAPPSAVKPVDVSRMLDGRSDTARDRLLMKFGGDESTRRAIESGLLWLKRQQRPGGNWQLHAGYPDPGLSVIRTDTGATALALLCFLGTGNTHRSGDHADAVRRGLNWLVQHQKPNGDFHDHDELGRQTAYYAHSQATIALCEAYAMTGDRELLDPAEKGIRWLLKSQQPTMGGWKYQPQDDTTVADLSVTGWALMALHTARMARIDFPNESFERGSLFLDEVSERGGARYKYEPTDPVSNVSVAMTAEGLLCRQFLGWPRQHPAMIEGVEYLLTVENLPRWEAGRRNVYAWYYTGQVLHNLADDRWKDWYGSIQKTIVEHQVRTGSARGERDVRGSWHPLDPPGSPHEYADKAGRLYLTAMCLLILEMPYRHLPIYGDGESVTQSDRAAGSAPQNRLVVARGADAD